MPELIACVRVGLLCVSLIIQKTRLLSTKAIPAASKPVDVKKVVAFGAAAAATGLGLGAVLLNDSKSVAHASANELHPAEYDWFHQNPWGALDHASYASHSHIHTPPVTVSCSDASPLSSPVWICVVTHCRMRRGFEVYRQVCSTCHSLDYIKWRNLVGVTHTLKQVKVRRPINI